MCHSTAQKYAKQYGVLFTPSTCTIVPEVQSNSAVEQIFMELCFMCIYMCPFRSD